MISSSVSCVDAVVVEAVSAQLSSFSGVASGADVVVVANVAFGGGGGGDDDDDALDFTAGDSGGAAGVGACFRFRSFGACCCCCEGAATWDCLGGHSSFSNAFKAFITSFKS